MPVARNVWQPIFVLMPAAVAHRRIMRHASDCASGQFESGRPGPSASERNSGTTSPIAAVDEAEAAAVVGSCLTGLHDLLALSKPERSIVHGPQTVAAEAAPDLSGSVFRWPLMVYDAPASPPVEEEQSDVKVADGRPRGR